MPSIETVVKASPGTCRDAATWLTKFASAAHTAASDVRTAWNESESGWHGSAGDAFRGAIYGMDTDTDHLANKATDTATALNDFADAIDAVATQMSHARQIAQAGGLTVNGTVILPPTPPGPAPTVLLPCMATDPAGAQTQASATSAASQAHQQAVNAYNAKVDVFNQVKGIVTDARTAETNAHNALNSAMSDTTTESSSLKTIGLSVTQRILDGIKGSRDGANELLEKSESLSEAAETFEKFATGNLAILTPNEVALLNQLGKESDQLAQTNADMATQLEQWISKVPLSARKVIAADPSSLVSDDSTYLKYLSPYLKGMPYVGTALTVGAEAWDVADGEKSIGQAVASGTGDVAGSAVGSAAGEAAGGWLGGVFSGAEAGFLAGTAEPGLGNVVGAIVGGVAGGFLGSEVAGKIVDSAASASQAQQTFNNTNYGTNPGYVYPG